MEEDQPTEPAQDVLDNYMYQKYRRFLENDVGGRHYEMVLALIRNKWANASMKSLASNIYIKNGFEFPNEEIHDYNYQDLLIEIEKMNTQNNVDISPFRSSSLRSYAAGRRDRLNFNNFDRDIMDGFISVTYFHYRNGPNAFPFDEDGIENNVQGFQRTNDKHLTVGLGGRIMIPRLNMKDPNMQRLIRDLRVNVFHGVTLPRDDAPSLPTLQETDVLVQRPGPTLSDLGQQLEPARMTQARAQEQEQFKEIMSKFTELHSDLDEMDQSLNRSMSSMDSMKKNLLVVSGARSQQIVDANGTNTTVANTGSVSPPVHVRDESGQQSRPDEMVITRDIQRRDDEMLMWRWGTASPGEGEVSRVSTSFSAIPITPATPHFEGRTDQSLGASRITNNDTFQSFLSNAAEFEAELDAHIEADRIREENRALERNIKQIQSQRIFLADQTLGIMNHRAVEGRQYNASMRNRVNELRNEVQNGITPPRRPVPLNPAQRQEIPPPLPVPGHPAPLPARVAVPVPVPAGPPVGGGGGGGPQRNRISAVRRRGNGTVREAVPYKRQYYEPKSRLEIEDKVAFAALGAAALVPLVPPCFCRCVCTTA